ncbi:MAG: DnaB-like helicase C-terminal domain-containing protein [Planctomycetota bacterium]
MTDLPDSIQSKLESIEQGMAYEHYRPLREAADEFIAWAKTPQLRVYTGIPELDAAMRGTAPGELTLVQGFTHSGKTLVMTELMINNPDTPLVLFTPDETRPLVLTKLTSALHGVDARELERRIQQDDSEARELLLETAERYGRLAIFDESVSIVDMDNMLDEAGHAMGQRPKGVIFDYAELLEGPDDVKAKMTALKAWGKRQQVALFVIHQTSRTAGSGGRKMTIDSGAYGGEQQATHVIGVRRKKYMHLAMLAVLDEKIANASNPKSIEEYKSRKREIETVDLPRDQDTITISLVKNKRPPCELVDDLDYMIDPDTGRVQRVQKFKDEHGNEVRVRKSVGMEYLNQKYEQRMVEEARQELEGL